MNPPRKVHIRLRSLFYYALILLFASAVMTGNSGCAGKKKAGKTKQVTTVHDDPDQLLKAKGQLLEILNDDGSLPLSTKEATLEEIKSQRFQDAEINSLIDLAEQKINKEKEMARKPEQVIPPQEVEEAARAGTSDILEGFFNDLVNNKNYSASDTFISQALKMFASESVPVLIIISQEGGMTDYDEPTTILKYLQYLDDTKNNINRISNIKINEEGLITELELIKK
ncbi:MAG TPA: hypothetical protein PKH94_11270 [Bacteroidales bacterium]|nr:hypothetical protein [Bacteroidales bacterium]HNS47811.1 hypothetical protein [Bacteroidales bacterium]